MSLGQDKYNRNVAQVHLSFYLGSCCLFTWPECVNYSYSCEIMLHQSSTLKLVESLIAIVYQTLKKYLEIWELKKYKSLGLIKESSL